MADPQHHGPEPCTRRQLLKGAAGLGGMLLFSGLRAPAWAAAAGEAAGLAETDLFRFPASPFVEPEVRRSVEGHLKTQLRVAYAQHRIGNDPVRLRTYEGALTGPTLRFRPGDVVEVDLLNQLPAEPPVHQHRNGPHSLNTTNLHTHGLHVSPSGNSDNVLIEVPPGRRMHYRFAIPKDHPPGVFYYHAHKHGSTAVQLANGMAGALIVEGDIDRAPEIKAARERLLVLQQLPYNRKGTVEWKDVAFDDVRARTTVNGRLKPRLELRPGEVQRWRFVHGGAKESLSLSLVDARNAAQTLYRIAVDGITTGRREALAAFELGAGNRTDLLVQIKTPGTYYLVKREVRPAVPGARSRDQIVAEVRVAGEKLAMALPSEASLKPLAPYPSLASFAKPGRQTAELSIDRDKYMVNGRPFDPRNGPRRLTLGAVDEWTVKVGQGTSFLHPFHIHVNPFQVIAINGKKLAHPVWQDTILVGGKDSGYPTQEVVFRTKYRDFPGKFMLHCHNAVHEDMGMMELVEIVP